MAAARIAAEQQLNRFVCRRRCQEPKLGGFLAVTLHLDKVLRRGLQLRESGVVIKQRMPISATPAVALTIENLLTAAVFAAQMEPVHSTFFNRVPGNHRLRYRIFTPRHPPMNRQGSGRFCDLCNELLVGL